MKRWLILGVLLWTIPALAKEKKVTGEVLDDQGFHSIQSYCISTGSLYQAEADAVKRVVKAESKPNGLLGRLPWKLLPSCAGADAVVSFEFTQQNGIAQAAWGGSGQGAAVANVPEIFFEAVLQIRREPSGKPAYSVRGTHAPYSREEALRNSFKLLDQDLKLLSPSRSSTQAIRNTSGSI